MSAMDKAWTLLKGNPDARVRMENDRGGLSARDFAVHPAAIGAANRQIMAEKANQQRLESLAQQQGGQVPIDTMRETARRMVTPEQRASLKNNSFDLKYKHPRFINLKSRQHSQGQHTNSAKKTRKLESDWARNRRRQANDERGKI